MKSLPTYITGNQSKADMLAKYLGLPLEHHKLDLDEIQSLDYRKVIEHKVKQAYAVIQKPVLVEDTSLEFTAFGRFPGTFIKHFIEEVPLETVCRSLDAFNRSAIARSIFGYYDGENITYIDGSLKGTIADHPAGNGGFGWDKIFVPEGSSITRAQMNEIEYQISYTTGKPFDKLKSFLETELR